MPHKHEAPSSEVMTSETARAIRRCQGGFFEDTGDLSRLFARASGVVSADHREEDFYDTLTPDQERAYHDIEALVTDAQPEEVLAHARAMIDAAFKRNQPNIAIAISDQLHIPDARVHEIQRAHVEARERAAASELERSIAQTWEAYNAAPRDKKLSVLEAHFSKVYNPRSPAERELHTEYAAARIRAMFDDKKIAKTDMALDRALQLLDHHPEAFQRLSPELREKIHSRVVALVEELCGGRWEDAQKVKGRALVTRCLNNGVLSYDADEALIDRATA